MPFRSYLSNDFREAEKKKLIGSLSISSSNTEIREVLGKLESISYSIERLSAAFYKTGNEKVGSELECYTDAIMLSVDKIDSILKDDIDKRYKIRSI